MVASALWDLRNINARRPSRVARGVAGRVAVASSARDTLLMKSLHIGIAACSAEGAALCYRTICTEAPAILGTHDHPEVTMHTPSLGEYMDHIYRGDWPAVGAMMLASAEKLARVGADFVICPDNTIHQALPHIEARSPLPWLHIAACVGDEANVRGFARLGLTGTKWLVESEVYPQKLTDRSIGFMRPHLAERE